MSTLSTTLLNKGLSVHTIDWAYRILRNGGSLPSHKTIASIDNFIRELSNNGILNKFVALTVFVPDNLIAALCPIYKTGGYDIWQQYNFTSAHLNEHGLIGDANFYRRLNSGVAPNLMSPTSSGLSAYISETIHQQGFDMGCDGTTTGYYEFATNWSDTPDPDGALLFCDESYGSTSQLAVGFRNPDSLCYGYFSGNRTPGLIDIYFANSLTAHVAHPNGIQSGYSNTTAKTAGLPSTTIGVFCTHRNNGASPGFYSSKRMSMAAMHFGFTATESVIFYNAIQLCRQRLGGGWR